jgi:hypothetical protein
MTVVPRTVTSSVLLGEALNIMESMGSPVSVLPVVDDANSAVGLLRLHDAYKKYSFSYTFIKIFSEERFYTARNYYPILDVHGIGEVPVVLF